MVIDAVLHQVYARIVYRMRGFRTHERVLYAGYDGYMHICTEDVTRVSMSMDL
jgi:hypothetical protein